MPEMTDAPAQAVECQCPQCGRLHRDSGFGAPPQYQRLMAFYQVETIEALIGAMEGHIKKLQAKLPAIREPMALQRVREG